MTPADLIKWRESQGISQTEAGRRFDLKIRAWQNYESGFRDIPRALELAIMRGVVLANLAKRLRTGPADKAKLAAEIEALLAKQSE